MSKEIQIRQECCKIWNGLKDKNKMIDYLIESKQRIAELEEQLKNAIVPKFKIGQEVYLVFTKEQEQPIKIKIDNVIVWYKIQEVVYEGHKNAGFYHGISENYLFATKEEALAKLEEVRNE